MKTLQCTGCPAEGEQPICDSFQEQDDGEGRRSDYCAQCRHSRDCHEPLEVSLDLSAG